MRMTKPAAIPIASAPSTQRTVRVSQLSGCRLIGQTPRQASSSLVPVRVRGKKVAAKIYSLAIR
jgi:hypothetical protein